MHDYSNFGHRCCNSDINVFEFAFRIGPNSDIWIRHRASGVSYAARRTSGSKLAQGNLDFKRTCNDPNRFYHFDERLLNREFIAEHMAGMCYPLRCHGGGIAASIDAFAVWLASGSRTQFANAARSYRNRRDAHRHKLDSSVSIREPNTLEDLEFTLDSIRRSAGLFERCALYCYPCFRGTCGPHSVSNPQRSYSLVIPLRHHDDRCYLFCKSVWTILIRENYLRLGPMDYNFECGTTNLSWYANCI